MSRQDPLLYEISTNSTYAIRESTQYESIWPNKPELELIFVCIWQKKNTCE